MKHFIFLILGLMLALGTQAQPQGRGSERIHEAKVVYISERLKLTEAQGRQFWPVYNRYEQEQRQIRRQYRKQRAAARSNPQGEAQQLRRIEDNLEQQEQLLQLKKRYKDAFLNVISAAQLAQLYDAERDFHRLLIRQLQERRGARGR